MAQALIGRNLWSFSHENYGVSPMRTVILTLAAVSFTWTCALAEEGKKPSAEETKSIQSALSQLGCAGGETVKEPSGLFEIDDANCKIGQYDFKLDKDFNVTLMSRD
jgi:hypothetical protein